MLYLRNVWWYCGRCYRDVVVEEALVESESLTFDVRCPLCDGLVRFVTPSRQQLANGETFTLTKSKVEPRETH